MYRLLIAAVFAFILPFSFVHAESAPTVQNSSNAECPAPDKTDQYLGASSPFYRIVIGNPSYTITNLSRQKCSQSCPDGGTISGLCTLDDSGKPACKALETCADKTPQKPTDSQTGAGTAPPAVSPDTNQTSAPPATPNQTVSQGFQSLGQSPTTQSSPGGLTTQALLDSLQGKSILQQVVGSSPSDGQPSSVIDANLTAPAQALTSGANVPTPGSAPGAPSSAPAGPGQAQVTPGTTFVPDNSGAGTFDAAAQNNSGIGGTLVSFFSGLLNGFTAPFAPASAANQPASQPIVYSASAPIVELPTQGNSPAGANSNLPMPQLVADVPFTTPQSPQNPNTGGVQTIIPGTTPTNVEGNSGATSPGSTANGSTQNTSNTAPAQNNPGAQNTSAQQQGEGKTASAPPGNSQVQPSPDQSGTQTTAPQQGVASAHPGGASQSGSSAQSNGTANGAGGRSAVAPQPASSNVSNTDQSPTPQPSACQSLVCQTGKVLQKALAWATTNLNPISSAEAQPYNPQSGQPLADAVNSTCKAIGCNAPLMQQALGGVCAIESTCDPASPHPGSQYQGFGQIGSTETQRAISALYQMSQSSKLSAAEQAQMRSAAANAQAEIAHGINPNTDSVLSPWILVGLHASLGTLQQVSAVTNDPRLAAAYLENAQLAPATFNGGFSPNKILPISAVTAYNQQGWIPVGYGMTTGQVAQEMLGRAGNKINTGIAYASQFTPSSSPAPIPASYAFAGVTPPPFGGYRGAKGTPSIQPGNPGYAPGTTRIASIPQTAAPVPGLQSGATASPDLVTLQKSVSGANGAISGQIQQGLSAFQQAVDAKSQPSDAQKATIAGALGALDSLKSNLSAMAQNPLVSDTDKSKIQSLVSDINAYNKQINGISLQPVVGASMAKGIYSPRLQAAQAAAAAGNSLMSEAQSTLQSVDSDEKQAVAAANQAAAASSQQNQQPQVYYYQDAQAGVTGEYSCAAGQSASDCAQAATQAAQQDIGIERAAQALKQQGASLPQGAQYQSDSAVKNAQGGYDVTASNGSVIKNVQLPSGTCSQDTCSVPMLSDGSGNPLGQDGKTLKDGASPLSPGLPPPTPDANDPTHLAFTDTRPVQPPVQPPNQYQPSAPTAPSARSVQYAQPAAPMAYAQPPYQTQPQPIAQPLPLPVLQPAAPSASSTPASAAVALVANPGSVTSGGTSRISWSSVGTIACRVTTPGGLQIGSTATSGSALSPALSTTTVFTALCLTGASIVSTSTSVIVY